LQGIAGQDDTLYAAAIARQDIELVSLPIERVKAQPMMCEISEFSPNTSVTRGPWGWLKQRSHLDVHMYDRYGGVHARLRGHPDGQCKNNLPHSNRSLRVGHIESTSSHGIPSKQCLTKRYLRPTYGTYRAVVRLRRIRDMLSCESVADRPLIRIFTQDDRGCRRRCRCLTARRWRRRRPRQKGPKSPRLETRAPIPHLSCTTYRIKHPSNVPTLLV